MNFPWYASAWVVYLFDTLLVSVIVIFLLLALLGEKQASSDRET
ncbi:MAG: hypothetical protein QGH40_16420 [bacterium]|nr:hypothetical protein [bacterium]